jgi:integrase
MENTGAVAAAPEAAKKQRRERGTGRIWQMGERWWIQYYSNGRQIRESSGSETKEVAKRLLRRRLGEAEAGLLAGPQAKRLTYEDLRRVYMDDYITNKRKSLRLTKKGEPTLDKVVRLDGFFKGYRASAINTDLMRAFTKKLQAQGLQDSTINRSLSALRRMFNLAEEENKIRDGEVPHFPMLKEPAARKGFFEHSKYLALYDALPDYLRPVLAIGYHTGMRRAEILGLRWEQVDFLDGVIHLNAGETKNDEARAIPIVGELVAELRAQHARRQPGCELVCFRVNQKGKAGPIGDFRKVWYSRCVKLEFGQMVKLPSGKKRYAGMILHDLRRTGVRNLVRSGVPESVAMSITGHKTRSVFDRYDITSGRDVADAGRKLEKYLAEQKNGANTGQIADTVAQVKQLTN